MSESFVWTLVIQLSQALAALHSLSILHRDIKSANVFLYLDGRVKLGDMNVSKVAKQGLLHTQTGTPYYASPEVWKDLPYDAKSDVWSLGCVLYEAAALKPPFRAEDMQSLFKKVTKGDFTRLPRTFSQDLQSLLELILNTDPLQRPSSQEILRSAQVERRIPKFEELVVGGHSDSSILLETIKFPKTLVHLSERLPGPNYEEGGGRKGSEGLVLPKLAQERKEDSPPRARFSRKLSTEKARQRDRSENPSRDHKKILRENYGALQKVKNPYSRSTPLRQDSGKHIHELSLDSIRTKQPRNLSSNGRLISRQPLQDSHRLRLLKLLQLDSSNRRLLPE